MQDIFSLIFFILTMLILGLSIYANIVLFVDNKKLKASLNQSILDNDIISNKLYESIANNNVEGSEGFLKFVTQSRDWAFEYIENVQNSISSLKSAVENGYPTEEEMKKLFSLLPENNKENNNE